MKSKAKILLGEHEVLSNIEVTLNGQSAGDTNLRGEFNLDTHPPAEFDENENFTIELADSGKSEITITDIEPLETVNNYIIRFQGSGAPE